MKTVNEYPMLSERSRGWLKYLHRKVNTPDDWDRGSQPSQMWDDKSTPPMLCFARFDLIDSSFVTALMAEQLCEPTWDRERGEFHYRFGLVESDPRGQANAVIMAAEAGSKQAWWRIFNEPNLRKFDQPTVSGVDFPRLGISQAIYDEEKEILAVSTYAAEPWLAGTSTTFTVDHLREPAKSRLLRDGSVYEGWRVSGETSIEIKAEVQDHAYLVVKAEGQ